jgi:DNA-binding response OmpR family regulator
MPNILLVDDDEQLRSMLKIVLTRAGHEVQEACNGNEALKFQGKHPADLMITDIIMPDREGLDTIREVRRNNTDIKIIAMSGGGRNTSFDYLTLAKKMGADYVLAKPFSNQEILRVVQLVL